MSIRTSYSVGFAGLVVAGLLAGCRGEPSSEPPIVPIRNMHDQPRYNVQRASAFFADGRSMRPQVEGTIAQEMPGDEALQTGRSNDGSGWLPEAPKGLVRRAGGMEKFVVRGQERYNVYCTPCHGYAGDGNGMVAHRAIKLGYAAFKATDLHEPRLAHAPDGQIYATITNGVRNMPAYRHSIPLEDRWAIVAYVRALQVSKPGPETAAAPAGTPTNPTDANAASGAKP